MILSQASEWTSSSDEEMLFDEMDQEITMFFQCAFNAFNFEDLLNYHEDKGLKNSLIRWRGFEMFWLKCGPHPPYSRTSPTSH
jgi:hypothetical protein